MYTRAVWEDVNSIKGTCTSAIYPNLEIYCVSLMYTDVQRWTIITNTERKRREDCCPHALSVFYCQLTQDPLVEMRCWLFIHCWREVST
jgi:hypothetical protein